MKEGTTRDPGDRDRQQRELTAELHHDAQLRAEHKRRVAAVPEPPAGAPQDAPHAPPADPGSLPRPEPPHKHPGTPAPGHARPDDDLGTEMPELPPEAYPDPSPHPFHGDPGPTPPEPSTNRPPRDLHIHRKGEDGALIVLLSRADSGWSPYCMPDHRVSSLSDFSENVISSEFDSRVAHRSDAQVPRRRWMA